MRSTFTLFIFLLTGIASFAQINYEPGYIIKNNGNRVEVLIRNSGGIQRDGKLLYKTSEEASVNEATPADIKAFGIGDDLKFISRNVGIFDSANNGKELDEEKEPSFVDKEVFLQVFIEGEASLYFYGGKQNQFFYSTPTTDLESLIYKKYRDDKGKIFENREFRRQLFEDLKCNDQLAGKLQRTDYRIKDLIDVFTGYNECRNAEYRNYFKRDNEFKFNLSIRPGVNFSNFQLVFGSKVGPSREFSEVSDTGIRLGIETEFVLPFNRNKWAFFAEPTFQQFSYEENRYNQDVLVDFSSIEVPLGIRYYMYLNDDSKIFINAAFVPVFNIDSEVYLQYYDDIGLSDKTYFAGGVGFKYKDKYSAEFRVGTMRDIIEDRETRWYSEFQTVSFIIGYTIF